MACDPIVHRCLPAVLPKDAAPHAAPPHVTAGTRHRTLRRVCVCARVCVVVVCVCVCVDTLNTCKHMSASWMQSKLTVVMQVVYAARVEVRPG